MKRGKYNQSLIGQKFNYLTVIEMAPHTPGKTRKWICQCECGNISNPIIGAALKNGGIKSCGCLNTWRHNKSGNPFWKGYGEISGSHWSRIKYCAKVRNLEFNITIEFAWNLFLEQDRRCVLTGIELQMPEGGNRKKMIGDYASLDRKDSSIGYIETNVQWTHFEINLMKMQLSEHRFIELCSKVTEYNG